METKKLTLAITAESLAGTIASLKADGLDDRTRRLRELAGRVYDTVADSASVTLVLADSGKVVTRHDLLRVASEVRFGAAPSDPDLVLAESLICRSGPVHLVALCNAGETAPGFPCGSFPDRVTQLIPLAGVEHTTVVVDQSVPFRDLMMFFRNHAHPFDDALLIDQYLMSKPDAFLKAAFVPLVTALLNNTWAASPRITLIESSKRLKERSSSRTPAAIAEQDLVRLTDLLPEVDWSVVFVDLDSDGLQPRKSIRSAVSGALHDRMLVTNTMLLKSGYGFAVADGASSPARNRDQEVLLASTTYDADGALEKDGRQALLRYASAISRQLKRCAAIENAVGIAGNVAANRLLAGAALGESMPTG